MSKEKFGQSDQWSEPIFLPVNKAPTAFRAAWRVEGEPTWPDPSSALLSRRGASVLLNLKLLRIRAALKRRDILGDRPSHRVFMTFFQRSGWKVQFLEADLRTPLPRKLTDTDPKRSVSWPGKAKLGAIQRAADVGARDRDRERRGLP
jgi:hypothetical protein